MDYIRIQFEDGTEGYQEICRLNLVRYCDLEGNTISPDGKGPAYITDPIPASPSWALPDLPEVQPKPQETRVSKLEYLSAFTDEELAGIYTIAKTNVYVELWLEKFHLAEFICISDPLSQAGVRALESAGLLSSGRANEILTKLGV